MLRNLRVFEPYRGQGVVLNEVLSLNAQECTVRRVLRGTRPVLNEVLSLNAQECQSQGIYRSVLDIPQ